MAVYVDDMQAPFGRMKMSHMVADTAEELFAMADKIGVARRWVQYPDDLVRIHFDICQSKKALAVRHGAVAVTWRWVGLRARALRQGMSVPAPERCEEKIDGEGLF